MPEEKVKTEKHAEKVRETKREIGPVIYVGPTIRKVIAAGTVFLNGRIPEVVKNAAKECPAIMELIVPAKEGLKAQREVSKEGTVLRRYYDEVKKLREE